MYRRWHRPARVLVVEDNPTDVKLLQMGLDQIQSPFVLEVATDGKEAIAALRRTAQDSDILESPDLVLLDLNLPGMDGHEVLRIIRADSQLALIPVIVWTCSISGRDILSAYRAGANSYVPKPHSVDETLDLVRTLHHYWLELSLLPSSVRS